LEPYVKKEEDGKKTHRIHRYDDDEDDDDDDGNFSDGDKLGAYGSHGLHSIKAPSFSFKDAQIYEIFDFKEQKLKDNFIRIQYFNKDARRKILFTSNTTN
jgi:hypothetical protein